MHTGEAQKITSFVLVFIMCAMEKVLCTTYRVNYSVNCLFFNPSVRLAASHMSVGCIAVHTLIAQSETGMQLLCMLCRSVFQ